MARCCQCLRMGCQFFSGAVVAACLGCSLSPPGSCFDTIASGEHLNTVCSECQIHNNIVKCYGWTCLWLHVLVSMCRACSSLFSAVRGVQKLDLSDTVIQDDAMQAVAQLSNLDTLNLAYSGTPEPPSPPPPLPHPLFHNARWS